jgi:hypothetical protein
MELNLFFKSREEYERAKDFFENESAFYANEMNDELRCLTFNEEISIDAIEKAITDELTENNFNGYWFEAA